MFCVLQIVLDRDEIPGAAGLSGQCFVLDDERPSRLWGSGRQSQAGDGVGFRFGLEQLAKSGAELAVDDGAAELEQEIGAAAGPAHLLEFVVHPHSRCTIFE
jgi:hypothetical protein